jgi:hypothetical protein
MSLPEAISSILVPCLVGLSAGGVSGYLFANFYNVVIRGRKRVPQISDLEPRDLDYLAEDDEDAPDA